MCYNTWAKNLENLEMNLAPWSEIMWEGKLCFANTWKIKREARVGESSIFEIGINITCFDSLSMMTRILV